MIIEVKGTKSQKPETDASHERYVLKNVDKRSSAPLFFTAFLTGLALYLKSAFPLLNNIKTVSDDNAKPDDPSGQPDTEQQIGQARGPELVVDNEPGQERKAIGSGEALLASSRSKSFELADSPAINIQDLNLPNSLVLRSFGGISVSFRAANDNGWGGMQMQGFAAAPSNAGSFSSEMGWPQGNPATSDAADDEQSEDEPDEPRTVNRAPRTSGPVHLYDVYGCAAMLIGLADLLRGATDPDGDALQIKNISVSSGTLIKTIDGWSFDPQGLGPVTITYQISDGALSVVQTAHFNVLRNPPILGTDSEDILVGSECADDIDAKAGSDLIDGRGGSDTLIGGDGDDHIVAGSGDDVIMAGVGADIVFGGLGDDHIWGGAGDDRLFGDEGRDTIFGDDGDDTISGGDDADLLFGGAGNDAIAGDAGDDRISGDDGNDTLHGGAGDDIVLGNAGMDIVDGGDGSDLLIGGSETDTVRGGAGDDVVGGDADAVDDIYDGGDGIDVLDYSAVVADMLVDVAAGTASSSDTGTDTLANFEVLRVGAGDDRIEGSDGDDVVHANGGDDVVTGFGGDDTLSGGAGDDQLAGGQDSDLVEGDSGNDTITGDLDASADVYDGGEGIDTLDYSTALLSVLIDLVAANASGAEIGADTVNNFEIILSGAGADAIVGSEGNDTLSGSHGDDTISGRHGGDTLDGGGGNDVLSDGLGADAVLGGEGNDVVLAAADLADDYYSGGAGMDTLDYSQSAHGVLIDLQTGTSTGFDIGQDRVDGFEKIVCGVGDDTVIVGNQAVVLSGGAGGDTFEFQIPTGSSNAEVIHQILDFMVGDRIEMSKYQIFEEVINSLEQRFESVYGEQPPSDPLPIKVRHEGTDELAQTLIEVDIDQDHHYEMTINLTGHHVLMIVENA